MRWSRRRWLRDCLLFLERSLSSVAHHLLVPAKQVCVHVCVSGVCVLCAWYVCVLCAWYVCVVLHVCCVCEWCVCTLYVCF